MDALLDVEVGAGPAHPRMHIAWMDDRLVFFLFGGRVTDSGEPPACGGHTDKVMMVEEEDE